MAPPRYVEILESRISPSVIFGLVPDPHAPLPAVSNAPLVVTSLASDGPGSLSAAILLANTQAGPDLILFKHGLHGTVKLSADLPPITDSLEIDGPGILLDGGHTHRILSVSGTGDTITLSGLKLMHGSATIGGGLEIDDAGGTVTLTKCLVSGNVSLGVAAIGHVGDNGYVAPGPGGGGGIYDLNAQLTLLNTTVSGNAVHGGEDPDGKETAAARGGGIFVGAAGSLALSTSKIQGNTASGAAPEGAGVFNLGALSLDAKSTISGNKAIGALAKGGGLYAGPGSTISLTDSVISGNLASGVAGGDARGGGLYLALNSTLTLTHSMVSLNLAKAGDGVNGVKGGTDARQLAGHLGGNASGGGIQSAGTVTLLNSVVSGNLAMAGHGGNGGNGANGKTAPKAPMAPVTVSGNTERTAPTARMAASAPTADMGVSQRWVAARVEAGSMPAQWVHFRFKTPSSLAMPCAVERAGTGEQAVTAAMAGMAAMAAMAVRLTRTTAGFIPLETGAQVDLEDMAGTAETAVSSEWRFVKRRRNLRRRRSISVTQTTISGNTSAGGAAGKLGVAGTGGAGGAAGGGGAGARPGFSGFKGPHGAKGLVVGDGENGGDALGGGIASTGTLNLLASTISGNVAQGAAGTSGAKSTKGVAGMFGGSAGPGYAGQDGYAGGTGYDGTAGGDGFSGGNGGKALGGGIFGGPSAALGIVASTISGNTVHGAAGGNGTDGGAGGHGGNGGNGGRGGRSYTSNGTHHAQGNGGDGGNGGAGGAGGKGGNPGAGGTGIGGGIYSGYGTLLLQNTTISANSATGGLAGKMGLGGAGGQAGKADRGASGLVAGTNGLPGISGETGANGSAAINGVNTGAGIAVIQDSAGTIHNCTIAGNKAAGSGGGLAVVLDAMQDNISVVSTIIALNRAGLTPMWMASSP